jgi:uncharacterized membrane protein
MPPLLSDDVADSRMSRDRKPTAASGQVALQLLGLFAIALIIRFTNLAAKPAWMDEVATTLFSLGNYSRLIPLNEIISLDQVLRPLQITPGASANDVITHLLIEDNHPPTYFVLAYGWMTLFQKLTGQSEGVASLWAARALPAFFGALAVPAIYLLAWFSFGDSAASPKNRAALPEKRLISLLCALLMAVSPFGIFMAQEARHYSLAILAVIASLSCFVLATKAIQQRQPPSWGIVFAWIGVNTLGLTIHFFCGLTLLAEGMTLLAMLIQMQMQQQRSERYLKKEKSNVQSSHDADLKQRPIWRTAAWGRTYIAAAGTLAGALLWLPILLNFYGSPQTSFLKAGGKSWQFWINPIVQSLASWLYAVLSPVTRGYGTPAVLVIVVSCVVLLGGYAPWLLATLQRALKFQLHQLAFRTGIQAMGGFFIMANVLFLIICYSLGFDITRGHRYSFVFFPSILILVGVSLAPFITAPDFSRVKLPFIKKYISGKAFVATVIAISFMGSQIIVHNLSNLKFYSADRLVNTIQATSTLPVVIGTDTKITAQPSVIGIEIMSVAWEIQRNFNPNSPAPNKPELDSPPPNNTQQRWVSSPQFIIAENNESKGIEAEAQLVQNLKTLPRPFDLWLLNMSPDLTQEGCEMPTGGGANKGSFSYVHYVCDR